MKESIRILLLITLESGDRYCENVATPSRDELEYNPSTEFVGNLKLDKNTTVRMSRNGA